MAEDIPPNIFPIADGYEEFLRALKERIRAAQVKAALAVNVELTQLYWEIGQSLWERQQSRNWGEAVIVNLAKDLQATFPGVEGFSRRNLYRMRAFYLAYHEDSPIVPQAVAQIPWGHNAVLLEKVKDAVERLWYAQQSVANGWSRNVLVHQIESRLYERQGKAITNFRRTLPALQSDLAQEIVKDPCNFDFLTLGNDAQERDLERGLLDHLRQFLLELGSGFAFLGSQYHLKVGGEDFYIDLLFYHIRLRCYVVIDLKRGKFQPEFAGKMNFYLAAVDGLLRHPEDAPSIGIILCKTKSQVIAEYTLQDMGKPIGVAEHRWTERLPEGLRDTLPTAQELEAELSGLKIEERTPTL